MREPDEGVPAAATASLLARARKGDAEAENQIVRRYTKILRRWGHGRLPLAARTRAETDDLVQVTLMKTLAKLTTFDPRHERAFTAYLKKALVNQIRDEIRYVSRRPREGLLSPEQPATDPSPLASTIETEFMERYEAALSSLTAEQQEAVVLRVELGYSYPELAKAVSSPSPNAARMLVSRGLARLAEVMGAGRG